MKKKHNLSIAGPICKMVEEILNNHTVKRQAYHSNSFVGNDCYKVLRVSLFALSDTWILLAAITAA